MNFQKNLKIPDFLFLQEGVCKRSGKLVIRENEVKSKSKNIKDGIFYSCICTYTLKHFSFLYSISVREWCFFVECCCWVQQKCETLIEMTHSLTSKRRDKSIMSGRINFLLTNNILQNHCAISLQLFDLGLKFN